MHIINLVYNLQAMDISLAIVSQLKSIDKTTRISTILKLTSTMTITNAQFLFELAGDISDDILLVGNSRLHRAAEEVFIKNGIQFRKILNFPEYKFPHSLNYVWHGVQQYLIQRFLPVFFEYVTPYSILLKSHADVDLFAQVLVHKIRDQMGKVYVCLDGNYPPGQSIPMKYFSNARTDLADLFLLYSNTHKGALASVGYDKTFTIGYPMLFPARRKNITANSVYNRLQTMRSTYDVSIFTRGEISGGGPQIMSNKTLKKILLDIFEELLSFNNSAHIRIKPHPLQDISFLERLVAGRHNVSITYEHPSMLAATSDLVITTWSTSIIEALAFGVPSIEYFIENEYFRSVYPAGSSFRQLGIMWADDRMSFRRCLDLLDNGGYQVPDVAEQFGHRMDLSVFDNVRNL